jgi:hypothetical protein
VIVIAPTDVNTPIFEKQPQRSPYLNTDYGDVHQKLLDNIANARTVALPTRMVIERIMTALTSPKPKTRYLIPSGKIRGWYMRTLMPDRVLDRKMVSQFFGGLWKKQL